MNSFKKLIPQEQHNGIPITIYPNITVLYRFMPLEAFEATLQSWSLKATLCYEANDPFEFTPQSTAHNAPVDIRANSPISSPPPFLCFSRNVTTASMWGLYANAGKGVCLVFGFPTINTPWAHDEIAKAPLLLDYPKSNQIDESKKVASMREALLLPVNYSRERVTAPKNIHESGGSIDKWFSKLISTKDITWKSENEVRLVIDYQHACSVTAGRVCFSWPMDYLIGIVVGPRCKYSPAIIQQMLKKAYSDNGKNQNYFHGANSEQTTKYLDGFIVSQAYYHWKEYKMSCMPWGDCIGGEELIKLLGIAQNRLSRQKMPTVDAITHKQEYLDTIDDWEEICQQLYNQDGSTVMALRLPFHTDAFIQSPIYTLN